MCQKSPSHRDTLSPFLSKPVGRKIIAHGASRGETSDQPSSPGTGRKSRAPPGRLRDSRLWHEGVNRHPERLSRLLSGSRARNLPEILGSHGQRLGGGPF